MIQSKGDVLRILVVADDPAETLAVSSALSHSSATPEVTVASEVASADEVLREQSLDCILVDVGLRGDSAIDVRLAVSRWVKVTPVIVLTQESDLELAVDLVKEGASDCLAKSDISPAMVVRSVHRATALARARAEARSANDALERQALLQQNLAAATLRIHAARSVEDVLAVSTEEARKSMQAHVAVGRLSGAGASSASFSSKYRSIAEVPTDALHWLEAPLVGSDGLSFGKLRVAEPRGGAFRGEDEARLSIVAQNAALALENVRSFASAESASRARDELLAVVSHDLRNPLNTISMSTALLRQDVGPRELPLVERMQRAMIRMNRLIEDLLDSAYLEEGGVRLKPRREHASSIVREAVELAQPLAAAGCRIEPNGAHSDAVVLVDRERILGVLSNLLVSAIKASPPLAVVRVNVSLDGDFAVFSVADQGPGIDPAHIEWLSSGRARVSAALRKGAGLGLFIAKGLVEAHKGTLRVESKPGAGTRVFFTLPIAPDGR